MPVRDEVCDCFRNSLVDVSVPGMSFVQKCLHCDGDVTVDSGMVGDAPVNVYVPPTPRHDVPRRFLCAASCHSEGTLNHMWDHVTLAHPHEALVLDHTLSRVELQYLVCSCNLVDDFFNFLMLSPFGFFMVNVRWAPHKNDLFVGIENVDSCWTDWELSLCCENTNAQIRKKLVAVPINSRSHLFIFQFKKENCCRFSSSEFLKFDEMPKLYLEAGLN